MTSFFVTGTKPLEKVGSKRDELEVNRICLRTIEFWYEYIAIRDLDVMNLKIKDPKAKIIHLIELTPPSVFF